MSQTNIDRSELNGIATTANALASQSLFQRLIRGSADTGVISRLNQDLDRVMQTFQVRSEVHEKVSLCSLHMQVGTIIEVAGGVEETRRAVNEIQDGVGENKELIVAVHEAVAVRLHL